MKVLHAADVHLDRSFEGISNIPHQISEHLQQANQRMLKKIVNVAITNQVDTVIFAGDTFHQSRTSIRTQACFIEEMSRLKELDIVVVMVFGNHDYYIKERYWFDFPENVLIFDNEKVETKYFVTKNKERVAISGFSYEQSWMNQSKLAEFPEKEVEVDIHIGVYHGEMTTENEQKYAPFLLQEMKRKTYDYWALGHIHQPKVLSTDPLIAYAGTPQGHTKKEVSTRGVAVVTIEKGKAELAFESVALVHWQVDTYSLKQAAHLQEALNLLLGYLVAIQQEQTIVLTEIQVTDTEHLGEEFHLAYESGELLQYVQEQTLRQTNNQVYLFQLQVKTTEQQQKNWVQASPELLNQLEANYLQPTIFTDTLTELVKQSIFSSVVTVNESWRERCIQKADEIIKEEFVVKEEQP